MRFWWSAGRILGFAYDEMLLDDGHQVVVVRQLSSGHHDAVLGGDSLQGDIAHRAFIDYVFATHALDAVMHFASFIQVESRQSIRQVLSQQRANTVNLLDAMVAHRHAADLSSDRGDLRPAARRVDRRGASESAGQRLRAQQVDVEQILADYEQAYGLRIAACAISTQQARNRKACRRAARSGEPPDPLRCGRQQAAALVKVFARTTYPDGTCIRDYIT